MTDLNKIPPQILESIELVEMEDLAYFQLRLLRGLEKGQSPESLEKVRNQIKLLEDAVAIYRERRQGEPPSES